MNLPSSQPRVELPALVTMNGQRIEFALVHRSRRICGFGTLHIHRHQHGVSASIRRLGSFRNGRFLLEEYPIHPDLLPWIRFHADPSIAHLSLYEPRSSLALGTERDPLATP